MTLNCEHLDNDKMCQMALRKAVLTLKSISTVSAFANFLHANGFHHRHFTFVLLCMHLLTPFQQRKLLSSSPLFSRPV